MSFVALNVGAVGMTVPDDLLAVFEYVLLVALYLNDQITAECFGDFQRFFDSAWRPVCTRIGVNLAPQSAFVPPEFRCFSHPYQNGPIQLGLRGKRPITNVEPFGLQGVAHYRTKPFRQ